MTRLVRLGQILDGELEALLAASEAEGLRFVRRVAREWMSGAHRFDAPGEVLLGAREGDTLVGICGLSRDPYANDDRIGRLRNLYVLRSHRCRGIGSALATEVMRLARETFSVLRLRAASPESAFLYEQLGFTLVTDEPDATHVLRFTPFPA